MKNIAVLHKENNLFISKVHLISEELWIGSYLDYILEACNGTSYPVLKDFRGPQIGIRKQTVHKM